LFSNDAFDGEGLIPLLSVSETNKLSLIQISVSNSGLTFWCQKKEVQNTEGAARQRSAGSSSENQEK
jgi:hypothetical protein